MVTTARTRSPDRPLRRAHRDDGGEKPFIWRGGPRGPRLVSSPPPDAYMVEMSFWPRRIGYSPYLSGIGVNADCIQTLTGRLEKTAEAAYAETGMPVRRSGHSLGGR